jgi:hypothetical protein
MTSLASEMFDWMHRQGINIILDERYYPTIWAWRQLEKRLFDEQTALLTGDKFCLLRDPVIFPNAFPENEKLTRLF